MNEKLTRQDIGGLIARLAVGGVFIYSGLIKALAPAEEFAFAIESYKVVGPQLALIAANVVPWVELWAGLLLAAGVFTRLTAGFIALMLVFFELLLGQAWLRGLEITSCGCFGAAGSNSLGQEFVQNLALLLICAAAFKHGLGFSADRALEKHEG
ncbi:MAG: hypothetical protein A2049_05895 [Elusimicrobia bacterium GWA2_62_23]|nr:MAG: hypothetical protein A2049_05895 [Elusimicrobia bacterium GWA2_62_23]OGR69791.1 MAG: hypothetical protein A2179_04540 [Elusimicrobia bacterium GWC2_63_65]